MKSFTVGNRTKIIPNAVMTVPTAGRTSRPKIVSYLIPSKITQIPNGMSSTDGKYCVNVQLAGNGESQPPKNKMVHRQDTVIMLVYSAMKNMANIKLAYSVWNPATSSDSASGRSKATRLVSATA